MLANQYTQQEGSNFDYTFSFVVKATTFLIILSIDISIGWSITIKQLDVKNVFLYYQLREEVVKAQPSSFVDPRHSYHVSKLHRFIYGLHQAPQAWFQRFSTSLNNLCFKNSRADPSMFLWHSSFDIMILLLYVNDIILTNSSMSIISSEFSMKALEDFHYFLEIEAHHALVDLDKIYIFSTFSFEHGAL